MDTDYLRIYKASFNPVGSDEEAVPLTDPHNLGLRTKLGGKPSWIQDDETPACAHCRAQMKFVAQIDSIEHESTLNPNSRDAVSGNQHYMFGDVGMIYVFFCYGCCLPASVFQCY